MVKYYHMKIKFKIHPFYYIVAIFSILTGYFKDFIIITIIILIHELGHILAATICHWKIDKVIILPFGGLTVFHEFLNRKMIEELFIVSLGPIFQLLFTYIFRSNIMLYEYSMCLLILNLIPIIPLDGSKLWNLILEKFYSYQKSYLITIYSSFIFLIILTIYYLIHFNLVFEIFFFFLWKKVIKEYNERKFRFYKFILERKNYSFPFQKYLVVHNINEMKRDYKHIFIVNQKQYTEKEFLFDK